MVIVVKKNKGFEYAGFLIYAMALYAFYAVITSVINVVKFRKYGSPVMSATGTGACVIVLGMAVFMIAKSTKILNNISQEEMAGGNTL